MARIKLQLFSCIRHFLQSKAARKRCTGSNHVDNINISAASKTINQEVIQVADSSSVVLQRSVKRLHFGSWEEKEMAALEIQRIAKEDVKIKRLMAELGVIHVLVSMVASEVVGRRRAAVQALIELADGTYT